MASLPLNLPRKLLEIKKVAGFLSRGPEPPDKGIEAALESVEAEKCWFLILVVGVSVHLHRQQTSSRTLGRTMDLVALIFSFPC
jgi:hypothetical protein